MKNRLRILLLVLLLLLFAFSFSIAGGGTGTASLFDAFMYMINSITNFFIPELVALPITPPLPEPPPIFRMGHRCISRYDENGFLIEAQCIVTEVPDDAECASDVDCWSETHMGCVTTGISNSSWTCESLPGFGVDGCLNDVDCYTPSTSYNVCVSSPDEPWRQFCKTRAWAFGDPPIDQCEEDRDCNPF